MGMLYNFISSELECRYHVFKHAIDYAARANLFDLVLPYLTHLDAWMVDWAQHLSVEDKRILYRDIANYLQKVGKRTEAYSYLKKYHELCKGANADVLDGKDCTTCTLQLLQEALNLPAVIQFDDILAYDTVKAFAKSKDASKDLVKVCEVFLSGDVNDLKSFHGKNQKLFETNAICFENAIFKIQLLTLATMVHGKSEVTLEEVSKQLDEDLATVEKIVVKALSENVIDGRIDQIHQKLLVKSAFQRNFETKEWEFLDTKLNVWISNLENVIKFIGEQKNTKEK